MVTTDRRPIGLALLTTFAAPMLLASWFVLSVQIDTGVHVLATFRVWAVVAAITLATGLLWLLVLRRKDPATIAASASVVLVLGSRDALRLATGILLLLAITALIVLISRIRGRTITSKEVARSLLFLSAGLFVISVAQGLWNGTLPAAAQDLARRVGGAAELPNTNGQPPDIYLVLLDGYPRGDELARLTGDDNGRFLSALEERGFQIADAATSSYMYTDLTLISMLHGRDLVEIPALSPLLEGAQAPSLNRQVLNAAPLLMKFRELGYQTVANAQAWDEPGLRAVDVYLDGSGLNEFERHFLRYSLAGLIWELGDPGLEQALMRRWVDDAFASLEAAMTDDSLDPRLALIHVPLPHFPLVYASGGTPADPMLAGDHPGQIDAPPASVQAAYLDQVQYLNERLLEALDQPPIDEDAIVVIFSDHGHEFGLDWSDGAASDLRSRFSTLFAARAPSGVFMPDVSVSSTLARILAHLEGRAYVEAAPRYFVSDGVRKYVTLREVPDPYR